MVRPFLSLGAGQRSGQYKLFWLPAYWLVVVANAANMVVFAACGRTEIPVHVSDTT